MDTEQKTYEIAYLLKPSIPEGETLNYVSRLNGIIEDQKGTIIASPEPRPRLLAYPIKKEKRAYFGWVEFRLSPERAGDMTKNIKTADYLLRHLIVEREPERVATRRAGAAQKSTDARRPRPILREREKPEEQLDLEALDKKLEEILGK